MRVTVLGCQSPYPGPGGATPGYLIQTEQANLLLDCGSGVISQLGRYLPLYQLDAVVLSHYHHDHVADVGVLQYGLMVHQQSGERSPVEPLPLYAPPEPAEKAREMTYRQATKHLPIDDTARATIVDMQLSFWRTDHAMPCYAVKIEAGGKTLVYGADSGPGTDWKPFAAGADLFICEGTFLRRNKPQQPMGHLSVEEAASLAQALSCKALMITHLFPEYREEEVREEAAGFTNGPCLVAKVGLQVQLS
ncbi:MBL fold metallo-hydrolase [Brevibacillus sp. SYP-B805]|uniref:MBL fold metallo-hydrolase n=1 Tax=Brevibacillus sp. SYP-B805 TaxID=1578199 RepID=UPI0013EABFAE|nr:MBL fold metallo-hydrolase [Brevibacillus sp. SYP-B805]NGQ96385.1 MBL fold metallo-hydrolase [Brevibacillus sp. SYP-B805]